MNMKIAMAVPIVLILLSTNMSLPSFADTSAAVSADAGKGFDKATLNQLATDLHQIHTTVAKIKRASLELKAEFNRTNLQIVTFDEYINKYIDGKPVPYDEQLYPYGFQNIGNTSTTAGAPLPPRKSYIAHQTDLLSSLTELMQQEIDTTASLLNSSSSDPALLPMKDSLSRAKTSLQDRIKELTDLSRKDQFDRDAIGNAAVILSTELSELDTTCKLVFKMALALSKK